jgi:hypothetical protein
MPDPTYNLNGGFKPTMKRFADLDGPDFFPTPPWATFALIDNEKFTGDIWECACGDGTMSRVLENTGCTVPSSDLYQRGYGDAAARVMELKPLSAEPRARSSQRPLDCSTQMIFCALSICLTFSRTTSPARRPQP